MIVEVLVAFTMSTEKPHDILDPIPNAYLSMHGELDYYNMTVPRDKISTGAEVYDSDEAEAYLIEFFSETPERKLWQLKP